MTYEDLHRRAVDYANEHTKFYFGDESVPCKPGTKEHDYWLSQYDGVINHWEST